MTVYGRPVGLQTWSLCREWQHGLSRTFDSIRKMGISSLEVSETGSGDTGVAFKDFADAWCSDGSSSILGFHAPALSLAPDCFVSQCNEIVEHCRNLRTSDVTIMDNDLLPQDIEHVTDYMKLLIKSANSLSEKKVNVFFHVYRIDLNPVGGTLNAPTALEILLKEDTTGIVGIQLDTHWLAREEFLSPDDFFNVVDASDPGGRDAFLKRRLSIHLGDMSDMATGRECSLGTGIVRCKEWLDFSERTASVQNVILEHGHEMRDGDPVLDVFPLASASLAWLQNNS